MDPREPIPTAEVPADEPSPDEARGPASRRVGSADLMIASVAVALTLNVTVSESAALANTVGYPFQGILPWLAPNGVVRLQTITLGPLVVMLALGGLMAATPTVLLLGLRRRSEPLRSFLLRPGPLACACGSLGLAEVALLGSYHFLFAQAAIPGWIAVGWALLAVTGSWRPPADGLDRAGRKIGRAWLVVGGVLLIGMLRIGGAFRWYD